MKCFDIQHSGSCVASARRRLARGDVFFCWCLLCGQCRAAADEHDARDRHAEAASTSSAWKSPQTDDERQKGLMFRKELPEGTRHAVRLQAGSGRLDVDAQYPHPARHALHQRRRHHPPHRREYRAACRSGPFPRAVRCAACSRSSAAPPRNSASRPATRSPIRCFRTDSHIDSLERAVRSIPTLDFSTSGVRLAFSPDWVGTGRRAACGAAAKSLFMLHVDPDRGIAQPGSASALGAEGRRFKSCCPDQSKECRRAAMRGRG